MAGCRPHIPFVSASTFERDRQRVPSKPCARTTLRQRCLAEERALARSFCSFPVPPGPQSRLRLAQVDAKLAEANLSSGSPYGELRLTAYAASGSVATIASKAAGVMEIRIKAFGD